MVRESLPPPTEGDTEATSTADLAQDTTGLDLWGAATRILCDYLWDASPSQSQSQSPLEVHVAGLRVLEIGCGLGACGIVASLKGASAVRLTDGEAVAVSAAARNVAINGIRPELASCGILRWCRDQDCDAEEGNLTAPPRELYDVVMGSDLAFATCMVEPLIDTAMRHLAPGGVFLLSHEVRKSVSLVRTGSGETQVVVDPTDTVLDYLLDYCAKKGLHTSTVRQSNTPPALLLYITRQ
ncbi:hypothetical protein Pelo_4753 [Pelomyxa schiedti]|nr:hypothetical protein Pelo_4753 [Pelomyxa schiedti]